MSRLPIGSLALSLAGLLVFIVACIVAFALGGTGKIEASRGQLEAAQASVAAAYYIAIGGGCFLVLCATLGLALGLVFLFRSGMVRPRPHGFGLAVVGSSLSAASLVCLPQVLVCGWLLLEVAHSACLSGTEAGAVAAAEDEMRQLCQAARAYAAEHGERLPAGHDWPQVLTHAAGLSPKILDYSPYYPGEFRSYAMNGRVGARSLCEIPDQSRTVLFFECEPESPPDSGPESLPKYPRHGCRYTIGFVDGHVERVLPQEFGRLIWEPCAGPGAQ